ncbi:nitrogen regulation protein NR(I) [Salinisphaera sp. Q1T1-3]|uniref:nitrogen regulation protein NR(I) n=1 Tax=Salinisphaera sp. Q1T1-3 TaxID=2321229 RepID=UPI000E772BD0|nr:nitrogen regulation protein NR(I) [Salinisphaera sp. Q1T1-3]RJS92557.1 nitrogen regulation protein NR(I) [Salinisphaera sp. Q1T1-3]
MADLTAWVVDDDESIRWVLERAFGAAGIEVACFPGGAELLDALDESMPDVLLTDIRMPGISGLDLLERVHAIKPDLPIIIITAHSDLDSAVASYRNGAFEYLPKPFDLDEAVELVQRAALVADEDDPARPVEGEGSSTIIGEAPAMQEVFRAIGRLSASNITVLITGESGTGKELVAHALHENSPRAQRPFIAVNTAAIPKDLMESEFFGHEKGAFTGAATQRRGRFEQAHGGTLFLDEIGDMPADLQTRLLRVLQDGQFYRVGGHQAVKVDVRIVAATNQNLEAEVKKGHFREDLFHRLNVIRLRVPPLRERREDIPLLLDFFLARAAADLDMEVKSVGCGARQYLTGLDWAGNVRELENLCRWLTVMAPGREVVLEDLPIELRPGSDQGDTPSAMGFGAESTMSGEAQTPVAASATGEWDRLLSGWADARLAAGADHLLDEAVPRLERVMIRAALAHTGGHRQEAARLLGWGRNTLTRKIKELEMSTAEH